MRISTIFISPIKSCGLVSLDTAELERRGLRHDRRWLVVDNEGMFITQRTLPRMTLVSVQLNSDHMIVEAPGMTPLTIAFEAEARQHVRVQIWDDEVEAMLAGNTPADWFSEFLGVRCRLVTMTDLSIRHVDKKYATGGEIVSFADAFPMLLISEASLSDLNSRLDSPISMRRFRPNLVVEGCEPFAEDSWKEIMVGDIHMRVVKPCARCTIPTVNTATGEKGHEPLRTLATYRADGNEVMFGQNIIHTTTGRLSVGDEVRVLR